MTVDADQFGRPATLTINDRQYSVEAIEDDWVIEDEWWRVPIQREYFELRLAGGLRRTVFRNLVCNAWYLQDDPYPLANSFKSFS